MTETELHNYVLESTGNESNICQIYAIRDGVCVYNDCWHGFRTDDAAHVMSVTKSVMALLIGIAVDIGMWGAQFLPRSAMNTGVRMTARNSEYVYGCAKDLMVDIRFGLSALFASMSIPLIRSHEPGTVSWIIVAAAIIVPVVRYAVRVSKAKYL